MPIVPLLDVGEGYKSRTVSAQKRTNLYVELQQNADKASIVMYGTPGLTQAVDLGANPVRGARGFQDYAYVVSGNTLYQINNAAIYTSLGTLIEQHRSGVDDRQWDTDTDCRWRLPVTS